MAKEINARELRKLLEQKGDETQVIKSKIKKLDSGIFDVSIHFDMFDQIEHMPKIQVGVHIDFIGYWIAVYYDPNHQYKTRIYKYIAGISSDLSKSDNLLSNETVKILDKYDHYLVKAGEKEKNTRTQQMQQKKRNTQKLLVVYTDTWYGRGQPISRLESKKRIAKVFNILNKLLPGQKRYGGVDEDYLFASPIPRDKIGQIEEFGDEYDGVMIEVTTGDEYNLSAVGNTLREFVNKWESEYADDEGDG